MNNPNAETGDWETDDQHQKQWRGSGRNGRRRRQYNGHSHSNNNSPGRRRARFVDPWWAMGLLLHRWYWPAAAFLLFGAAFFYLGEKIIKPKFTATALLLRYETPGESDFFKTPLSGETFAGIIRSPELLGKIGAEEKPPIPPERFAKFIKVDPDADSDMVKILLAARDPYQAVSLINNYASNAVTYVQQWYAQRAQVVAKDYLTRQVTALDQDIGALDKQFRNFRGAPELTNHLARVGSQLHSLSNNLATTSVNSALIAHQTESLYAALGELKVLLSKYTDLHPDVIRKKGEVQALQNLIASEEKGTPGQPPIQYDPAAAATFAAAPGNRAEVMNPEADLVRLKLMSLEQERANIHTHQQQAELYASNPPGIVRVFAPATLSTLQSNHRRVKITLFAIFGGMMGVAGSLFLVVLVEALDPRLKSRDDVSRVTNLDVFTSLGNLERMDEAARQRWAFDTWKLLQNRLSRSANHGLVCGVTSSTAGEGRSTWVRLLADAAKKEGFRVLTIGTRHSDANPDFDGAPEEFTEEQPKLEEGGPLAHQMPDATAANGANRNGHNGNGHPQNANLASSPPANGHDKNGATKRESSLTVGSLASPAKVTDQLTGPNSQPMVSIPLPGWVWNLERRKQWREALDQWRQIDNLVIFVELPPANEPEAVLLGANLPNLLWLSDSGRAHAAQTRAQLETLRNARCRLVGAVLNRQPEVPMKERLSRWVNVSALFLILGLAVSARAQTNSEPENSTSTNLSFSVVNPAQRAAWQRRLTLGAGDVLNLGLYGQPDLTRTEVAIAPDGHVNYLQADVPASGLTIDELRDKLDQELGKYYRSPHTVITPVAFRSKHYYMLGKVMTKGTFVLDRPTTILEAIARAHGFESGLVDRNVIDLADFQHSFLMRGGQRISLDFDKLFAGGDLSQNVPVEPNDYIYIAGADVQEVYVVGEVRLPGVVTYAPGMTILQAISVRGGYSERAYKARVLVVRGSLSHPQYIPVDTHAMLTGKAPDFTLQPKDIIYVNSRPFIKVEELADLAATAFVQSIVTSWVGVDVVKPYR